MKITIGIPVFNQVEYLPDAIESALSQSVECEVIVCVDGSKDGSLEVAKKYPVKIIDQTNKGLASARNSIIMNMTGDFVLPLDADDILVDNCVEKLITTIGETNADIVAPSFKCFGLSQAVIILGNPTLEDFKTGNRIGYCSAIKRSALLAVGGYSPRMIYGYEDLHLTINLLSHGYTLATIPEVLWLYRVKENSMYTESITHHAELISQINRDFPEVGLEF